MSTSECGLQPAGCLGQSKRTDASRVTSRILVAATHVHEAFVRSQQSPFRQKLCLMDWVLRHHVKCFRFVIWFVFLWFEKKWSTPIISCVKLGPSLLWMMSQLCCQCITVDRLWKIYKAQPSELLLCSSDPLHHPSPVTVLNRDC